MGVAVPRGLASDLERVVGVAVPMVGWRMICLLSVMKRIVDWMSGTTVVWRLLLLSASLCE